MQHFVLAVIEAERIPCRMLPTSVAVKIQIMAAIEASESLHFVFHRMRVDYIHNYGYTQLMGSIYKLFQFLRSAESRRSRKKR